MLNEKRPAVQLVHEVATVAVDVRPDSQFTQVPAAPLEYLPAVQLLHTASPLAAAVPAAQGEQVVALVVLMKPGLQFVQEPVAPVENLPGTQSVQMVAPAGENVPPGHEVVHEVAAIAVEMKPGEQSVGVPMPLVAQYLPAGQSVQVVSATFEYLPGAHEEQLPEMAQAWPSVEHIGLPNAIADTEPAAHAAARHVPGTVEVAVPMHETVVGAVH